MKQSSEDCTTYIFPAAPCTESVTLVGVWPMTCRRGALGGAPVCVTSTVRPPTIKLPLRAFVVLLTERE